jgi:hypothetical protein
MAARKRQSKSIKSKPVPLSARQRVIVSKTLSLGSVAKPASAKSSVAKVSKKEMVLRMLRESDGTSIATIMMATGWQELVSQKVGGDRVYRIEKTTPAA